MTDTDGLAIPRSVDVVVVGAGAAGIAAARRLTGSRLSLVVLEARDRPGGRALTLTGRSGAAVDLGCSWLHSAERNPWTRIAEQTGFTVDKSPPPWERPRIDVNFPLAQQKLYRQAFEAFHAKLAAAAQEQPDRPAAELFDDKTAPWRPMLDAFSGYYNGAPFADISVHDYAAYETTDENWRVVEGYGSLIASQAEDLPILYEAPLLRLEHGAMPMKLVTPAGEIEARAVILAVPTTVLAHGDIRFDPPLPDKLDAAQALPLGHVDKAFLKLARPEAFEPDSLAIGRTDTAETGAYTLRPLGHGLVEAFFAGTLADGLEQEPPGAFAAFAIDELVSLFGSSLRRELKPLAESRWGVDPFTRGAYSHARPGMAHMRAELRRPVAERLFFAGEACSPHDFSTAHGAYQTGIEAAEAVLAQLAPDEVERREDEEPG
jgi:monoamine oxidase